jgi:2-polyprenyl-3-methyl-5-hydroxy-6-metoxy-1,4-benzoquinol methylase
MEDLRMHQESAQFAERSACINCGRERLEEVCSGRYDEGPVEAFIASDPWGEHPAPFLIGKRWAYVRCEECSQAFHRYILTPEWNERRFSKWMSQEAIAKFESKLRTPTRLLGKGINHAMHAMRLEALTRDLRGDQPLRVLDFGCGYGDFLSVCASFGFDATGVDRSTARRENAVVEILPEISELRGRNFHALTLFEVLEHLDNPRGVMEELAPLVAPGGVLVLETPNCDGVTRIETRQEYLKIAPMEHINGFTPATLQAFAERLGFKRIKPPTAWVTADLGRVARNLMKGILSPVRKDTTQQYFKRAEGDTSD